MSKKFNKSIPIVIILSLVTLSCICGSTASTDTPDNSTSTRANSPPTSTPRATNTKVVTTPTEPVIIGTATVKVNACNLRNGPGTSYAIIGSSTMGDTHQVYGKNSDETWLWIDESESIWIATTLVELDIPIAEISIVGPDLSPSLQQSPSVATEAQETATKSSQVDLIVDIYKILNKNVSSVEAIIGKPRTGWSVKKGEYIHLPNGGYTRIYNYNEFEFVIDYDNNNIAKYFQITEGLREYNYSLTEWHKITSRLNIYNLPDPEFSSHAVKWDNPKGYFIRIFKDSTVWSIQIWVNP